MDIDAGEATIKYDPSRTSIKDIRKVMSDGMMDVTGVEELQ